MFEYHTGIVDRPNKNVWCFQRASELQPFFYGGAFMMY